MVFFVTIVVDYLVEIPLFGFFGSQDNIDFSCWDTTNIVTSSYRAVVTSPQ